MQGDSWQSEFPFLSLNSAWSPFSSAPTASVCLPLLRASSLSIAHCTLAKSPDLISFVLHPRLHTTHARALPTLACSLALCSSLLEETGQNDERAQQMYDKAMQLIQLHSPVPAFHTDSEHGVSVLDWDRRDWDVRGIAWVWRRNSAVKRAEVYTQTRTT
jgi:hypothetical protein